MTENNTKIVTLKNGESWEQTAHVYNIPQNFEISFVTQHCANAQKFKTKVHRIKYTQGKKMSEWKKQMNYVILQAKTNDTNKNILWFVKKLSQLWYLGGTS